MSDNKTKAVLYSLNFSKDKNSYFNNNKDIENFASVLKETYSINSEVYTNDVNLYDTSYIGFILKLNKLALESWKDDIDCVILQYNSYNDVLNNIEEGIYPSDYEDKGVITKDILNNIFALFNPKTKIVFICDTFHNGNIVNLKYKWDSSKKSSIYNEDSKLSSKIICISISDYSINKQYETDDDILEKNYVSNPLTSILVKTLKQDNYLIYNIFDLIYNIKSKTDTEKLSQIINLTSSYDLNEDIFLFTKYVIPVQKIFRTDLNSLSALYNPFSNFNSFNNINSQNNYQFPNTFRTYNPNQQNIRQYQPYRFPNIMQPFQYFNANKQVQYIQQPYVNQNIYSYSNPIEIAQIPFQ
jgi:hypothetical protein